jgi:hypothetical protein
LGGGGVNVQSGGSLTLQSTIIAKNTTTGVGGDLRGTINSAGTNLIGISTGGAGFTTSDLLNVDPKLGALANNGGPTETQLIQTGSPAIGAGSNPQSLTIDQRGFPMVHSDGTVDIGAVAFNSSVPTATITSKPDVSSSNNSSTYDFVVQYADSQAIQATSINGQQITVTGPNGYSQVATAVAADKTTDGTPINVTYEVTPPNGTAWKSTDNGTYAITLGTPTVKDGQGNLIASGVLGAFNVQVAPSSGLVEQLYKVILGRNADPTGLANYQAQLNNGATRAAVATALWTSDEHRTQQITQYYETYLHRAPDATGQAGWLQFFHNGGTEDQMIDTILTSPEYRALHSDNASFVNALYTDVLGRNATAAEAQPFIDALNGGSLKITDVVSQILYSGEKRSDEVTTFFTTFLNRTPETDAVNGYVDSLNHGQSLTDVAVNILSSDEFFSISGLTA